MRIFMLVENNSRSYMTGDGGVQFSDCQSQPEHNAKS